MAQVADLQIISELLVDGSQQQLHIVTSCCFKDA